MHHVRSCAMRGCFGDAAVPPIVGYRVRRASTRLKLGSPDPGVASPRRSSTKSIRQPPGSSVRAQGLCCVWCARARGRHARGKAKCVRVDNLSDAKLAEFPMHYATCGILDPLLELLGVALACWRASSYRWGGREAVLRPPGLPFQPSPTSTPFDIPTHSNTNSNTSNNSKSLQYYPIPSASVMQMQIPFLYYPFKPRVAIM